MSSSNLWVEVRLFSPLNRTCLIHPECGCTVAVGPSKGTEAAMPGLKEFAFTLEPSQAAGRRERPTRTSRGH